MPRPPDATAADWEAETDHHIDETTKAFRAIDAEKVRMEAFLVKHPGHRDATRLRAEIADCDDALARMIVAATDTGIPRLVEAARRLATVTVH